MGRGRGWGEAERDRMDSTICRSDAEVEMERMEEPEEDDLREDAVRMLLVLLPERGLLFLVVTMNVVLVLVSVLVEGFMVV